ncbi:MAG TPA: class IV adenylate cyclase [Candidatus Colwellbacteria bacterium]|jgi:predicted adenylyl cyclase CyaB|nr:class IV adenylate cyclase [Candidatus Colwellbacteria bacterium]
MIETEIRAKVGDLRKIADKIISLGGEFVSKEQQIDKVFGRPEDLDENHQIIDGHFSSRIRQKSGKISLDFKEIKRGQSGIDISAPINSIETGVKLLTALGFEEAFSVSKARETYKLKDFEICLDDVEKLGSFIEIEWVGNGENYDSALQECKSLLEEIDPSAVLENKKYGDLMQELINSQK